MKCGNKTRADTQIKPGFVSNTRTGIEKSSKKFQQKRRRKKYLADFGMGYRGGSYGGFCSLVETKTWQPEGSRDQELGRSIIWGQLSKSIVILR